MKTISTLIVDDEPLARSTITSLLKTVADVRVVGEAGDGRAALAAIERLRPELVFLDVQMPGLTGVQLLARMPAGQRPVIVFVTAYDEFALKAFELHAVDYLLKPYTDERFAVALDRARRALQTPDRATLHRQLDALLAHFAQGGQLPQNHTTIVAKSGGDLHVFPVEQIKWVEGQGDYLRIHGTEGSALVRETMGHFLQRAPAGRFVRVHKSTIVNAAFIRRLETIYSGDYRLQLRDGTELRVSRHYRGELQAFLQA